MRKQVDAGSRRKRTVALRVAFGVYLAVVLVITLTPSPEQTSVPVWQQGALTALRTMGIPITFAVAEALANVAMFIPFGMFAAALLVERSKAWPLRAEHSGTVDIWAGLAATVLAFALSGAIEILQLAIPGRVSSLQDVVLNGSGALLGSGVVVLVRLARRRIMAERDREVNG